MDLFFDTEFRALIYPLTPEERQGLETSLRRDGNLAPIVVWKETRLVLDGHHRYDICQQYDIPLLPPTELSFQDRDSASEWLIRNQFARRNLSPWQRSVLALKLEEILSLRAKKNLTTSSGGMNPRPLPMLAKAAIDTREELAKSAHVSHGTLDKVKELEAKATPEQKDRPPTIQKFYLPVGIAEVLAEQRFNVAKV